VRPEGAIVYNYEEKGDYSNPWTTLCFLAVWHRYIQGCWVWLLNYLYQEYVIESNGDVAKL
jgi:hypothetical protein